MLRHWEGETEEGRDGETEKGREGRKEGGKEGGILTPSVIPTLPIQRICPGAAGRRGGGRSGEEEEKNEKETETAGERKRKREGGKGVGQGWVYPTTPLLPSPLPPNDREAVSAL